MDILSIAVIIMIIATALLIRRLIQSRPKEPDAIVDVVKKNYATSIKMRVNIEEMEFLEHITNLLSTDEISTEEFEELLEGKFGVESVETIKTNNASFVLTMEKEISNRFIKN